MEGMKVNGDLVLVEGVDLPATGERLSRFLSGLAQTGVNMSLFIGGKTQEGTQFECCVAASDEGRVKALMHGNPELKTGVEFAAPVDLLTLFPHRFDLKILGLGLTALARARIPLHDSVSVIPGFLDLTHVQNSGAAFG